MEIVIRTPRWEDINANGIPRDSEKVRDMFNALLDSGKLKFIPRKIKITDEEIKGLWMPAAKRDITYLVEADGGIVASGTLLVIPGSNQYSRESGRGTEYTLTFNPDYPEGALGVTRKTIEEAKSRGLEFITHVSVENTPEIEMFKKLGYEPTRIIKNYKRYEEAGLNPEVYEYII